VALILENNFENAVRTKIFSDRVLWKKRKLLKTLNRREEFKFLDTVVAKLLVFLLIG
jgi:hypothetical protein